MVTGFTKFEFEEFSRKDIQQTISDYKNYKKWFKFPAGIKGLFKMIIIDTNLPFAFRLSMGKQP